LDDQTDGRETISSLLRISEKGKVHQEMGWGKNHNGRAQFVVRRGLPST